MRCRIRIGILLLLLASIVAGVAPWALAQNGESAAHGDPIARLAFGLAIVLLLAKLGGVYF